MARTVKEHYDVHLTSIDINAAVTTKTGVRCLVKELLTVEAEAALGFLGDNAGFACWLHSWWRGLPRWLRSWRSGVGFRRRLLRGRREIGLLCPREGIEFGEESIGLYCLRDGDRTMAGGLRAACVLVIRDKLEVTSDLRRINAGVSLALGPQIWRMWGGGTNLQTFFCPPPGRASLVVKQERPPL